MRTMTPDSGTYCDRLVIYPSRVKLLLVVLGAFVFVVAGIWIGIVARWVPILEVFIATYIGVPFFAFCGLYAAYRLAFRRPALEIDWTGITDAASALGAGHLNWDEVDHVVLYKVSEQTTLGIIPRNLDVFLSRQHPVRRSVIKVNMAWGYAPINIPQVTLRMKLADLAGLLHTRYGVRVEGDA